MRVNVYAEEMTTKVDIIAKTIEGRDFTGLRFWLHLPVTLPDGTQAQGPFMHHPDDDDSSAVTFWGKADLRQVLKIAQDKLTAHYGARLGLAPHQARVVAEKADLDAARNRLLAFSVTPFFQDLPPAEQGRLKRQAELQGALSDLLAARIAAFPKA